MYKRYDITQNYSGSAPDCAPAKVQTNTAAQSTKNTYGHQSQNNFNKKQPPNYDFKENRGHRKNNLFEDNFKKSSQHQASSKETRQSVSLTGTLLGFLPSSVYNPATGKVFGVLSPEDLLIGAVILVLLDNQDGGSDNTLLILALLYILLSDRLDLPFDL